MGDYCNTHVCYALRNNLKMSEPITRLHLSRITSFGISYLSLKKKKKITPRIIISILLSYLHFISNTIFIKNYILHYEDYIIVYISD